MFERYSRQMLFDSIGREGQARLLRSRVVVIGCGALGSAQIEMLARAGTGRLRIADRDFVEESNLQRQTMFTEADAKARLPKAVATARRVREINSEVEVEAIVADVNRWKIEDLIKDATLVLDGTDNFQTRYLINDACVKRRVSWIYGAAVSSYGVTMTVRPGITPCLRCIFEQQPAPGSAPTCDTAGVIMPIIFTVAAQQVTEALKLIVGDEESLHNSLMQFDVWRNEWRKIKLGTPSPQCPACSLNRFDALEGAASEGAAVLCGRDAVQITPAQNEFAANGDANMRELNLDALARRLEAVGSVQVNQYLLRVQVDGYELSVFRDGRAIIRGTNDATFARSLYARYVGS